MSDARAEKLARDEPTFVANLVASDEFVWRAAKWLRDYYQRPVTIPPLRIRPSVDERLAYLDGGDLFLGRHRIEVKHRSLVFTSGQDYPYPTVLVDEAYKWDNARPKPAAYLIYNRAGSAWLLVAGSTAEHWQRVTRQDHGKARDGTFYECPIELVKFYEVTA